MLPVSVSHEIRRQPWPLGEGSGSWHTLTAPPPFLSGRWMHCKLYQSRLRVFLQEEIHEVEEKLGKKSESSTRRLLRRCCTPIFLEAFLLTFIAEWGDRSQIATITLAAHDDPISVTIGAIIGHSICTGAACVGGELLARKISQRTMAAAGGTLFFLFAAHQFWSSM
jgi:putative Ca2+/H+ antiporter (TMEM165/GDT1 family)